MKTAQNGNKENLLLLLLLLIWFPQLFADSNYSDNYWLNETESVQEENNGTYNSDGYRIISDINENNSSIVAAPVDPVMKVALVALLLHVLIVGGGIIIYCIVYSRARAKENSLLEINQRLQSPLTLTHLPNNQNCPCHGCRVARQILSGLIAQHFISERAEQRPN